ncbi:MAG TPA: T9SS type A sorting domain-containing protein, partial [Prolixibacteraceae bacterium]|nr:T9SS type A sorting domain-containing protein [Prolixibacteraceae bacterium]
NPIVRDIEKDDKGNIWFGTENGICVSTQASNINIVPKSSNRASISWTSGKGFVTALPNEYINDLQKDEEGKMWIATNNGVRILNAVPESSNTSTIKRVVFISESIVQLLTPFNWTTYTANAEYKKGSAIGTWYCIYNGTGTSVEVTGLSPNTTYWVAVFDYQGEPGFETYSIAGGEGNPESFLSLPVSADEFTRGEIRAYPVPFNEYLNISFEGEKGKTYEITISDLEGKVFKKVKANGITDKINTSDLSRGAYMLKVSDGKQERTIKVIK